MRTIAVANHKWGNVDIFRQTYKNLGEAGLSKFHRGMHVKCDYVLMGMTDNPHQAPFTEYRKEERIMVAMENPSIWNIPTQTICGAGIVISPFICHNNGQSRFVRANPSVPWFYGIEFDCNAGLAHSPRNSHIGLEELAILPKPKKDKILSIIVSGKKGLPGYEWRTQLADRLKRVFGKDCDIFGFGHNPIADKKEALDRYQFTVTIENESHDYYWTEKLSDAYLGHTYPIYAGDNRVQEDFPAHISTIKYGIDIDIAVKKIAKVISRYDANYERAVMENRHAVLFKHNLFYMIDRILQGANK